MFSITDKKLEVYMADLWEKFGMASENVKNLAEKPSNDILLKLYALYKQGTEGDIQGEKPGLMDFKGLFKYNAWEELKGKSKEDAQTEYIDLVNSLLKQ